MTPQPYRPSNGTEGDFFMASWCEKCALSDYDGDGCMIQLRALAHGIDEPEYPSEWVYSSDGAPCCTAFATERRDDERCHETPDMFA